MKLGHVAPMTGPQAHLGKDNERRVACHRGSERQGHGDRWRQGQFELLAEDDQADPKQGTIVAQKLVDAKVNGVIGHLNSGTTIPASKLYSRCRHSADFAVGDQSEAYAAGLQDQSFRVMANDIQQGKVLGEFAAKMGAKSVAIIDDRSAYGQGLADEFKKAAEASGLKVVANEYTPMTRPPTSRPS